MSFRSACYALTILCLTMFTACAFIDKQPSTGELQRIQPSITSAALRVHNLEAMLGFYSQAFGITFHKVETSGVTSHLGDLDGITIKLVPIRESANFVDFPEVQFGMMVPDIAAVVAVADSYGGRQEGSLLVKKDLLHGAIRDPDGNTIELLQPRTPSH